MEVQVNFSCYKISLKRNGSNIELKETTINSQK